MNSVNLTGRLTADPELRKTTNDISVTSFTVAVDKYGGEANFIDIVCWRATAEFVTKWFKKGNKIEITGELATRSYEDKNGNKRKAVEVVASNVGFCESKKQATQEEEASEPTAEQDIPDDDDGLPF